ncbi:sepiapterin reductase-like isoform X2 [Patiria miniata]|uniref:Sepiapterin reductase n=1 Tax=Patiria miniata TaxID=46514 RepID=A0A914B4K2_PATMI|nr:sepiapterin reductase-like isoform X2 [Patiria miniata]
MRYKSQLRSVLIIYDHELVLSLALLRLCSLSYCLSSLIIWPDFIMSSPSVFGVASFCIITGASRGLGRELALSLGSHLGDKSLMVLTARSSADLEDTSKQVSACSPGVTVKTVTGDLGDESKAEDAITRMFEGVECSQYQHAMLIHNAGSLGEMSYICDLSPGLQTLRQCFTLNVTSCMALSTKFLRVFPKRDGQRRTMVHISSLCAIQPMKSLSLYCSTKAARDMFMKTMAIEDSELRVLNYSPGALDTAMNDAIVTQAGDSELREKMAENKSTPYFLTTAATCKVLLKLLTEDTFESGKHIDYWDVEVPPKN